MALLQVEDSTVTQGPYTFSVEIELVLASSSNLYSLFSKIRGVVADSFPALCFAQHPVEIWIW